jgi:hypothetical protein
MQAASTRRTMAVSVVTGLGTGLAAVVVTYLLAIAVALLGIPAWHPTW